VGLPAASAHPPSRCGNRQRDGYVRHRPEQPVLYQSVAEHWPAFRQRAEEAGGLPRFVVRELDELLRRGRLEVRGVNVHAKQLVDGRDRRRVERLCRYLLRPPIAHEHLQRRADGRLLLSFKSVWKDGTRAVVLEPDDLLSRLAAAVPPPRWHTIRYFGVLCSHASPRSEVVPARPPEPTARRPPPAAGDQTQMFVDDPDAPPRRRRWAWLLAHVFAEDLETCERRGGPMRWLEAATTEQAAARLLAKLGLAPQPPPPAPHRVAQGQLALPFPRALAR
jgi:hypothetical protein